MQALERSRLKRTAAFFAVIAAIVIGAFLLVWLGFLFAPFIIAFLVASLMEPVLKLLERRFGINRKLASPVILGIFLAVSGFLLALASLRLIAELKDVSALLPGLFANLYEIMAHFMDDVRSGTTLIPPELAGYAGSIMGNVLNSIAGLTDNLIKSILSTAVSIPQACIFILTTIMASYFFSSGRISIWDFIRRQLPDSWIRHLNATKRDIFSALSGYFKATLILITITFTVLYAGFTFAHLDNPLLLAFLVALVDALPIIGTGTVLIPWALYSYITGNVPLGSSILIIFAIVLIIRQLTEPRIVGKQIGLHPLVTLVSMYVGFQLDGFAGMIAGPFAVLLVKSVLKGVYGGRKLKDILGS